MKLNIRCLGAVALLTSLGLVACNEHPVEELADNVQAETQQYVGSASANKVDILWVVDNSGSMCEEQADLKANFNNFIGKLDEIGADFQLAVITTDMQDPVESGRFQNAPDGAQGPSCQAAVNISDCPSENGEEFPPLVIKSQDPRYRDDAGNLDVVKLQRDFGCNATTGTSGNGFEMGLEAAKTSLDVTLRTSYNAGFLRDDAYLAVIFLTDENDCSDRGRLDKTNGNVCEWFSDELVSTDEYVKFFTDLKGGQEDRVIMAGIIAPDTGIRYEGGQDVNPSCVSASGEGYAGYRYENVINSFSNSSVANICQPPFDRALEALALLIVESVDNRCLAEPVATCENDSDCKTGACEARGGDRKYCQSVEVRVEVERDASLGDIPGKECEDVVSDAGTRRRCILDGNSDYIVNYNDNSCPSGSSLQLNYALGGQDDLIVRYPRSVTEGAVAPLDETPAEDEQPAEGN